MRLRMEDKLCNANWKGHLKSNQFVSSNLSAVDGECDVASFHVGGNVVKNKEECLQLCKGKLCPYLK